MWVIKKNSNQWPKPRCLGLNTEPEENMKKTGVEKNLTTNSIVMDYDESALDKLPRKPYKRQGRKNVRARGWKVW